MPGCGALRAPSRSATSGPRIPWAARRGSSDCPCVNSGFGIRTLGKSTALSPSPHSRHVPGANDFCSYLLWKIGKPRGTCPLAHPPAACLPSGGRICSLHVQLHPSLQPPMLVQDRVHPFSQCPQGRLPGLRREKGCQKGRDPVLAFQEQLHSGVPDISLAFFRLLYRGDRIGTLLKS